jgi:uncharacterized protein YgiM (DUF1202 family)
MTNTLIACLLALTLAGMQQGTKQIGEAKDLCNYAKVYHVKTGSYLSVRSGPGVRFARVDRLQAGRTVYICDEHGEWYKVCYGGPDTPCGLESTGGLDVSKTVGCKSGWVDRKWIDVLSG